MAVISKVNANSNNLEEVDNAVFPTIAHHIYLIQMLSMPKNTKQNHTCVGFWGSSPFGTSRNQILNLNNELKIKKSKELARIIFDVASAFDFSSRFQIGYWLGILNKESRFCFDVCGGANCKNLQEKVSQMQSYTIPYADLGMGQINFETAKGFIEKHFSKYENNFQKLIDIGYFEYLKNNIKQASQLKKYFLNLLPQKKQSLDEFKLKTKNFFNILRFDEKFNLALSLPIFLQKTKEGINLNEINDEYSRLFLYQKSKKYKKYSEPFYESVDELSREHQYVWARSFGVLTYNGHHKYALDYAMDVYCIKSLVDSYLLRSKKLAHQYVYGQTTSPFYAFVEDDGEEIRLKNCDAITEARDAGYVLVNQNTEKLLDRSSFLGEEKKLLKQRVEDIVNKNLGIEFSAAVAEYGKDGRLFLYSFVRKILYPSDKFSYLSSADYNGIIMEIESLNKNILLPGNTVSGDLIITYPAI